MLQPEGHCIAARVGQQAEPSHGSSQILEAVADTLQGRSVPASKTQRCQYIMNGRMSDANT